ncbi:copper amine oxidase [Streptomyces sp. NPDC001941]|uniref:copper amine oxidase n=1 Tax=Streptomyces sp. NPDC001941 TaxID=3154659 RepID=UPI00331B6E8B
MRFSTPHDPTPHDPTRPGTTGPRPREPRRRRSRVLLAVAALLAALPGAVAAAPDAPAAPRAPAEPAPADCGAAYRIERQLDGGTTWRMCWRYDSDHGLVLGAVSYQPKGESRPIRVLDSAKLAQIHVPYDDGNAEYDDLTGAGFGWGLQSLRPEECPGGTLIPVRVPDQDPVNGLCTTTRARGHAYRLASDEGDKVWQAQATDLLVYTVNKVAWYEYVTEWRFTAEGAIAANVGATGSLAPEDYNGADGRGWPIGKGAKDYATSHAHNVFWKLDFALDGSRRGRIEQYDSKVTPPRGSGSPTVRTTRTPVTRELAGDATTMRWWRVVSERGTNTDGHPRSYEIVPGSSARHAGRPFTRHDVYFTQARACEQFASDNIRDCGAQGGTSVDRWVNGEQLVEPVVWVNIGFHHIARDEDQQPMPVHWQGFQLVPRDVTAMNPLTPDELAGHNGHQQSGS